ncbi:MAG: cytochrome c [Actinobacteria bacterium]|nr:cytochrome c [Actinomycetota bacterium]
MRRIWRPVLVGAVIALVTFALAKAQIFEPSAAAPGTPVAGNAARGEAVFGRECATCHGTAGEGGSGPALQRTSLDASFVTERVRAGAGVMPGGLVTGQDEADVVAYVVGISAP